MNPKRAGPMMVYYQEYCTRNKAVVVKTLPMGLRCFMLLVGSDAPQKQQRAGRRKNIPSFAIGIEHGA